MSRPDHEMNQRHWWRDRRRQRKEPFRSALHADLFEQNNPELVLSEICRGASGRLAYITSAVIAQGPTK